MYVTSIIIAATNQQIYSKQYLIQFNTQLKIQ